jgi:hypothetical protein
MAIKSVQIALSSSTATPLLVQGSSGTQFLNITGSMSDQLPIQVKNTDSAITIYLGGVGVTSSTGYPLLAGQSISFGLLGSGDVPYAISASGTPTVAVMAGRQ